MRTKLVPDILNNLLHWAATDLTLLDLAGASVNDFTPLRFRIGVHGVVEAGDQSAGKERPVCFRQGQHFGHFFGSDTHATKISAFSTLLASVHSPSCCSRG